MKNIFKTLGISLILASTLFISTPVQADPPNVPGGHGESGDQAPPAGGGAPIGSGIIALIAMAGAYGSKKVYNLKE